MPAYAGAANAITPNPTVPTSLEPGGVPFFLFGTPTTSGQPISDSNVSAEIPAAGQASVSACLVPAGYGAKAPSVSLQFIWTANPGAATIVIQEADTDADGCYITPTNTAYTVSTFTASGANFVARVDLSPTGGRFLRIKVTATPNAAPLIAKLTEW